MAAERLLGDWIRRRRADLDLTQDRLAEQVGCAVDTPASHQSVAFLLDHLPPQLHLVIATRTDPPLLLARLRAHGELTELRARDLCFTPDEAAVFLTMVMRLPLTADQIAALERRTEGRIAPRAPNPQSSVPNPKLSRRTGAGQPVHRPAG